MKKIYIAPLTEVVKVNAEQIVCTSEQFTLSSTKYDGSGTVLDKEDADYDEDLW